MGQDSKIQWTDHTFNPWRGCTKVSQGCAHCYAETLSARNPGTLGIWGPNGTRVVASESMWQQPVKWNKVAQALGERHRVFCASLADVFEGPETMPEASERDILKARVRLMGLIARTPNLDWLLLTKRPQNVLEQLKDCMMRPESTSESDDMLGRWLRGEPPANVWLGTSVENQEQADKRIPLLLKVPAKVRFLSCEPLLGSVDLQHMDVEISGDPDWCCIDSLTGRHTDMGRPCPKVPTVHWVIVGGESGPDSRPMHPDWVRGLRDQCISTGVPFFFKQHGEWLADNQRGFKLNGTETQWGLINHSGTFRPVYQKGERLLDSDPGWRKDEIGVARVGKKNSGRLLDGREWNEMPEVSL